MDPRLYKSATQGNVESLKELIKKEPTILHSLTPQHNTALHIAARLGHKDFAEEILKTEYSGLLILKNADEDTPLHIAARAGHLDIIALLINYATLHEEEPFKMINKQENTPLHEAVSHQNSEIAVKLLKADPSVGHMVNKKKETPLHIAAREGLPGVVWKILEHAWVEKEEETQPPPSGTGTPLHQAVIGGHYSIIEILLNERDDLIKVEDDTGNNALHYAAKKNDGQMVGMLLRREHSLAYAKNNEGRSSLHVAAACSSKHAIKEILKNCPDAAEQTDTMGMNALHIAVVKGSIGSLTCLLKNIQPEEIINQTDNDGNTPLHLAAKLGRIQSSLLLLKDKRVDPCIVNRQGQTPRTLLESLREMDIYETFIWKALKNREAQKFKRRQFPEIGTSRSLRRKVSSASDEDFKASAGTYTLVAALIATVTFAATFTMPGGYNQVSGKAILAKSPAFKAFVIANTIAMCSSLVVVFCFIWAWKDPVQFKLNQLTWGHRLTVVACLAMIVTLMTAVYLVVAKECLWVAIVVCVICCSAPFLAWAILGHDVLFIPL